MGGLAKNCKSDPKSLTSHDFTLGSDRDNMSESTMVAPVNDNVEEKQSTPTQSMPVKTKPKDYRQKLMTLKARIRYRENVCLHQSVHGFIE